MSAGGKQVSTRWVCAMKDTPDSINNSGQGAF